MSNRARRTATARPSSDQPIPFALSAKDSPIPFRLRVLRLPGTLSDFVPQSALPVPAHERPSAPVLSEAV